MMSEKSPRNLRVEGSIGARISNAIVHQLAESTGRGPTRARTTIDGRLVVCLLEDTLTRSERNLLGQGRADAVREIRESVQEAIRGELIALVEQLTGQSVVACMSANHGDPDYGIEAFVLESEIESGHLYER
jgi:uncharacterized protein YbcI